MEKNPTFSMLKQNNSVVWNNLINNTLMCYSISILFWSKQMGWQNIHRVSRPLTVSKAFLVTEAYSSLILTTRRFGPNVNINNFVRNVCFLDHYLDTPLVEIPFAGELIGRHDGSPNWHICSLWIPAFINLNSIRFEIILKSHLPLGGENWNCLQISIECSTWPATGNVASCRVQV